MATCTTSDNGAVENSRSSGRLTYDCEVTDTFGGEANYSWVRRETIELPDTASDRSVVMAGKAALGLTGVRCRTFSMGEGWELRPIGMCQVAFILPRY